MWAVVLIAAPSQHRAAGCALHIAQHTPLVPLVHDKLTCSGAFQQDTAVPGHLRSMHFTSLHLHGAKTERPHAHFKNASVSTHAVLICLQGKGQLIGVSAVPTYFVDLVRYMPSLRQDRHLISSSLKQQPDDWCFAVRVLCNQAGHRQDKTIGFSDVPIVAALWHDSYVEVSVCGKLNFPGLNPNIQQEVRTRHKLT